MTLKTQMVTDLSTFLNEDEFATEITYTPSGGSAATINGIFTDSYEGVSPLTGEVESSSPQIIIKESDATSIAQRDTMTINSTTYNVRGVQPHESGLTLIILSKD